jgi:hypothetical protein
MLFEISSSWQRFRALLTAIVLFAANEFAIEVTEQAGAEHGYPGLYDIKGKKLANAEFRQWVADNQLHVVISYKFSNGQSFEENALFRQQPELIQEKWSWKELKGRKPEREFAADFLKGVASAHIHNEKETKDISDNIEITPGRTFAGFGFSIALSNLHAPLIQR